MNIIEYSNSELWVKNIVDKVVDSANSSIKKNGVFNIVLVGGTTPIMLYQKLAELNLNYDYWNFWIGDERFPDELNAELNKDVINKYLINNLEVKPNRIHFMNVELGITQAPLMYIEELKLVNTFDLTLLGIGEDGHTASLFPGNNLGIEKSAPDVLTVLNSPKIPRKRMTLSARRLSRSNNILFLAKGQNKIDIIHKISMDKALPCTSIKAIENTEVHFCSN